MGLYEFVAAEGWAKVADPGIPGLGENFIFRMLEIIRNHQKISEIIVLQPLLPRFVLVTVAVTLVRLQGSSVSH